MYLIPFIYFTALTFYIWRKNRVVDVAMYMALMFAISSFCCVLMIWEGLLEGGGVLYDGWQPDFGFVPTILYCGLITVTILPFSFIRPELLTTVKNEHNWIMLLLTLFIVFLGALTIYLVGTSIFDLLHGDLLFLKNAGYHGDLNPADIRMLTMPKFIQLAYILVFLTILGLPLFFYYTCIEHRNTWLCSPLLLASISPILRGMLSADRTEIIYYGLMFLFCIVFFQHIITVSVKRFLAIVSVPVVAIGILYVLAVSASRFDETDAGTNGSMIQYAGQSYANYCYFYEHHDRSLIYSEREFPILNQILRHSNYIDVKDERCDREGFFIGVFASHVGAWFIDLGLIGSILYTLFFALFCILVIRKYRRTTFDITEVLMLFLLAGTPLFGIFYYRFYQPAIAFPIPIVLGLMILSKYRFIWKKQKK